MAYATVADLVTRFGGDEITHITDRSGSGVMDADAVQRALDDAAAEIDSYLSVRYQIPLPNVPPILTRIACDIARYLLWSERASEEVRARYEDARRLLEGLSKGVVDLGLPLPDPQQPGLSEAKIGQSVFAREQTGWF